MSKLGNWCLVWRLFCHFGQLCSLFMIFRKISRAFVLQLTTYCAHLHSWRRNRHAGCGSWTFQASMLSGQTWIKFLDKCITKLWKDNDYRVLVRHTELHFKLLKKANCLRLVEGSWKIHEQKCDWVFNWYCRLRHIDDIHVNSSSGVWDGIEQTVQHQFTSKK